MLSFIPADTDEQGMRSGSQMLSSSANVFDAFLFLWWSSNQQLQYL